MQISSDPTPKFEDKPKGPINVAFYAQRYLGTQQVHASQSDIIKSNFQLYFGLFFILSMLLICFLGYKFSKTDEQNRQKLKKKSNVLLGVDFEKKRDNTDKQILKTYFGYTTDESPQIADNTVSKKTESAENPFAALLRNSEKKADTYKEPDYVSSDEEIVEARLEAGQDDEIVNEGLDTS